MYPVTVQGRFVAAMVMVGGVGLLGIVSATIASWLVGKVSENTSDSHDPTAELQRLTDENEALRRRIGELSEGSEAPEQG